VRAIRRLSFSLILAAVATSVVMCSDAMPDTWKSSYAQLPLHFEPNMGQFDPQVRYIARAAGYLMFLTDSELVIVFHRANGPQQQAVLRMKLAGGRKAANWEALDKQGGVSNYFIGNNPAKWRTGVPNYGRVRAHSVYPGVDLVCYGNQGRFEYDLAVAPGADPDQVRLAWDGADSLRLNAEGDLVLKTSLGEVVQKRPRVYQDVGGRQVEVGSKYLLAGSSQVRLALTRHDRRRALVIDPVMLVYSSYLGGNGSDSAAGIAVDSTGSAYIVGSAGSTNFPIQSAFQSTLQEIYSPEAFVTKLSPGGNTLIYSTYLGGNGGEKGTGIAVDATGAAFVTGKTQSPDFPTKSPFQSTLKSVNGNAFVTKLSPAGSVLIYSTFLGGTADDGASGIALDAAGSAYVTGSTLSSDFPTQSAFQPTGLGTAFVTKFNPAGNALVFSTFLGGGNDTGSGIAVDASGSAYVVGSTSSANFPLKSPFQSVLTGQSAAFVTKFSPAGNTLMYSTFLGGSYNDGASGIAVDAAGSAYVTGIAYSNDFPTTKGAYQTTLPTTHYGIGTSAFVTKFSPSGASLIYSTYLGGRTTERGSAIAVDANGAAYVTGLTDSLDFPVLSAYQSQLPALQGSAFVTAFSPAGNTLMYSTYLGGSGSGIANLGNSDQGYGIALDGSGSAYIAGVTYSTDFPTTPSAYQPVSPNKLPPLYGVDGSAFVTKLPAPASTGPPSPTITLVANAESQSPAIAPNTWVEIKGSNLAPAGDMRTWQSSDFSGGNMPTALDGVSATVAGQPAYVYYISPSQINILTPPGAISGEVAVTVENNGTQSSPFMAQAQAESPSFFVFNGGPYVAATHVNGSYLGPTTLYSGLTSPARPGETVVIYANGFGNTSMPVVAGSETQAGELSPLPMVQIGGVTATVGFAGLVAPGQFQFNVVVPIGLPDGDQSIVASYGGLTTQSGTLITVQH